MPGHNTSTNDTDGEGVTLNPKKNQIAPIEFDYVSSLVGVKSVAMLVDLSNYTTAMADRLKNSLKATDVIATRIPIVAVSTDFVPQVAQAIATDADLIYSTFSPEGANIAKTLTPSTSTTKCLMGLANVDPAFVAQAELQASQRCTFRGVPEASQMPGAEAAKFVRQYERKFDKNPGVWGIFPYDEVNVLFASIEKAGTDASNPTLKSLKKTKNYQGVSGVTAIDPKTGNREVANRLHFDG